MQRPQFLRHALLVACLAMACNQEPPPPSPAGMPELDPPDGNFSGVVAERLGAGGYTYLRVGDTWVVTLGPGQTVGTPVDVISMGVRNDFRSKRLDRSFDHLVFGIVRKQETS